MNQPAPKIRFRLKGDGITKNSFAFTAFSRIRLTINKHAAQILILLALMFMTGCSPFPGGSQKNASDVYYHIFIGIFIFMQIISINVICLIIYLSRKFAKKENQKNSPEDAPRLTCPLIKKIQIFRFSIVWFFRKSGKILEFRARIQEDEQAEEKRLRKHYLYASCSQELMEMWEFKRETVHFIVHCFFLNWVCEYFYIWHAAAHDVSMLKMAGVRSDPLYLDRIKFARKMNPLLRRSVFLILIFVEPYLLLSKQVYIFFQALKDADAWWMGELDEEVRTSIEEKMSRVDSRYIQPLDTEEAARAWAAADGEQRAEIVALLKSAAAKTNRYSPTDIEFRKKIATKIRMRLWTTASEEEKKELIEVFKTMMEWKVNDIREQAVWAAAKCLSKELKAATGKGSAVIESLLDVFSVAFKNPSLPVRLEVVRQLPSLIQTAKAGAVAPALEVLNQIAADANEDSSYMVRDAIKNFFMLSAADSQKNEKTAMPNSLYGFANR